MRGTGILSQRSNVPTLPTPNQVSLVASIQMPPEHLVTSAFGFVFSDRGLLMTNLRQRGWDIPGGHLERGEAPGAAMRREVREETGMEVRGELLFAHQHIRIEAAPSAYRYPSPDSYQVFYVATVVHDHGLEASEETSDARFLTVDEVRNLPWGRQNRELFEAALAVTL